MPKKSKLILLLVVVTAFLFAGIQFYLLPARQAKADAYAQRQTDARTHDITAIEPYRSPYVGDNSNTAALLQSLPLGQLKQTYEIDSDACTVTIRYEDELKSAGSPEVTRRDMVYTAVAALAAIDNLNGITYQFPDETHTFTRKQVTRVFGQNLSSLLEENAWKNTVAKALKDDAFVQQFFT